MKKNSFVEGAVIATVAVIITKILGMLYVIPFYKIIGSQGGALYSYAYNIYSIFLGISSAGIPSALSKIISEYDTLNMKEAKYRTFKIGKKIIGYISVAAFLVMFIFAELIAKVIIGNLTGGNTYQDVAFVIRSISFAILVIPYLSVTKGYFQGHKVIAPTSVGSVLEQVIRIFVILTGSFLAYKVFASTLTFAVGVSVTGAFFGGLAAYLYLKHKMKKNKDTLGIENFTKKDEVSNKDIIKKIITYCVPFIIINIATNIYDFTDMVLILRGLGLLGFTGAEAEFIQSAITTWSIKISMVISAFAMGMVVSLVPNIVSAAVKKDWKDISNKMNRAYEIILAISIPSSIGICILARPIWTVFYGYSEIGATILSLVVVNAIFANLYSITFNTMQALNRFKLVYTCVFLGFGTNALLDIPYMYLCKFIGLPIYWGTIFATMTGFTVSILIATTRLRRDYKISYMPTFKMFGKILVPATSMALVLICMNKVLNLNYKVASTSLLMIGINIIVGVLVYVFVGFKMHIFEEIFGKEYLNKIIKKLTFNKVSIK